MVTANGSTSYQAYKHHAHSLRRQHVRPRTTTRWSGAAERPWFLRGICEVGIRTGSASYLASGVGRGGRHEAKIRSGSNKGSYQVESCLVILFVESDRLFDASSCIFCIQSGQV